MTVMAVLFLLSPKKPFPGMLQASAGSVTHSEAKSTPGSTDTCMSTSQIQRDIEVFYVDYLSVQRANLSGYLKQLKIFLLILFFIVFVLFFVAFSKDL